MTAVSVRVLPILTRNGAAPIDINAPGTVVVGTREPTRYAWQLGTSAASLTSLFGDEPLTLQGAEPTWHDGYASFPGAGENALVTSVEDTPELKATLGIVFRYPIGAGGPVTLWHSRDGNDGLSAFFSGGSTLQLNVGGVDTLVSGLSFARGVWNFLGIGMDFSTDTDNLRLFAKGRPMETYSVPDHRVRPGRKIAIGRQFGTSAGAWDCSYPFILVEQFAGAAAFAEMLGRVEAEMARHDIEIANAEAVA